jgi:hypothetical protein
MSTPSPAAQPVKGSERCAFCAAEVRRYYRVGSDIGCAACTEKLGDDLKTNPSRYYGRAVLAGLAASVVCAVAYGMLLIGARISFGSVFIGAIVASAMMAASKGTGGLRYRLTAVALHVSRGKAAPGLLSLRPGSPIWVELAAGFVSPIYRIQGSSGSMSSVVFLAIGLFVAWVLPGGSPHPESTVRSVMKGSGFAQ